MIKLYFTINRETIRLEIEGREIFYADRLFTKLIRLIPPDEEFVHKIIMSRNKIPSQLKEMFELTEKERIEYENAKNENELAEICIRDIKLKGGLLIKRE